MTIPLLDIAPASVYGELTTWEFAYMRYVISVLLVMTPSIGLAGPCEELQTAICADQSPECPGFLTDQLVGPDGKSLSDINRLLACQLAMNDSTTQSNLRTKWQQHQTSVTIPVAVTLQPHKPSGQEWDGPMAGGPDLAFCAHVNGLPLGCSPDGAKWQWIPNPKCRDSLTCDFSFNVHRGDLLRLEVVDVDSGNNDYVGHCDFMAGDDTARCEGPLTAVPSFVRPRNASSIIDGRIVGTWQSEADDQLTFTTDGRFIWVGGGTRMMSPYSIDAINGSTLQVRTFSPAGAHSANLVLTVEGNKLRMDRDGIVLTLVRQ